MYSIALTAGMDENGAHTQKKKNIYDDLFKIKSIYLMLYTSRAIIILRTQRKATSHTCSQRILTAPPGANSPY